MSQNTGDAKSRGTTPSYSVENPILGATVAYIGMKASQITILPGIARNVYLVHMLVTSAALPSTVAKTAVYSAVPHTQWPAILPSPCGRSQYQISSDTK